MTEHELADTIIATYISRLDELGMGKGRHFLYRAHIATGDPALQAELERRAKTASLEQSATVISEYVNHRAEFTGRRAAEVAAYAGTKVNDAAKKEQWAAHPDLYAYHSLIWALYYRRVFGGELDLTGIDPQPIMAELLANPDFTRYAVVTATNIVYLSRNLGLADIEDDFSKLFRGIFTDDLADDPVRFTNFVYGLTHIIIGDSDFYRRAVDREKYAWVKEALITWGEACFERLSLDVNAEVALCLCMLGEEEHPLVARVITRLEKAFDAAEGHIQREGKSTFNFAEHTNAVAVLLFYRDKWILN